ncbi:MAG TPA: ORF6N domain-containing protein [Terriglobia bacterium]|nr:ORF6N domain-containing protein [Terriglobia bacterium]
MTEKSWQAEDSSVSVPGETIERSILVVRGQKVMLDRDLAQLYGVETRVLNQAVRRNSRRFPPDFMFQMSPEDFAQWKSQIVMSKSEKMGLRRRPLVFTEQGVAMLSSVLGSDRAVEVNIEIMRAFVRLRRFAASNAELQRKLDESEEKYDAQFAAVFDAIRELMQPAPVPPKRRIGFFTSEE